MTSSRTPSEGLPEHSAICLSNVEKRAEKDRLSAEARTLAALTALEGTETATDSGWTLDRREGFTGVTSPDGKRRTWVMQQKPTEGIEN